MEDLFIYHFVNKNEDFTPADAIHLSDEKLDAAGIESITPYGYVFNQVIKCTAEDGNVCELPLYRLLIRRQ